MKKYILTIGLALLFGAASTQAYTCNNNVCTTDGTLIDVQAAHDFGVTEGGTIMLPSTPTPISWNARLNITKGITLQGNTTITNAGTATPTIVNNTTIQDNTPRTGTGTGIIKVELTSATQKFRLTGITFVPLLAGTATGNGAIRIVCRDSSPNRNIRIDHCNFDLIRQRCFHIEGWIEGVADNNVFKCPGSQQLCLFHNAANWGGPSKINGNGSWTEPPWWGTEKFFFLETNTIIGTNNSSNSAIIDAKEGARWVARYNYWIGSHPSSHGAEGNYERSVRASQMYNNTFDLSFNMSPGLLRGGTMIWHDNVWLGTFPPGQNRCCVLSCFRMFRPSLSGWGSGGQGGAGGNSAWDANATQADGTYVEGQPSYLFESGSHTGASGSEGIIVDGTKNWTPNNKWVGYSVNNLRTGVASFVLSSTSNTITTEYDGSVSANEKNLYNLDDDYEIRKVVVALDQSGRGKGDELDGVPAVNLNRGSVAAWPRSALEPLYGWNNVYAPSIPDTEIKIGQVEFIYVYQENRDYYNLGFGLPANTIPAAVQSYYNAERNGVAYTGEYTYPHPLVSGITTVTPTVSTANETSYSSSAFTPAANDLLLVLVSASNTSTTTEPGSLWDTQSLGFTLVSSTDNGPVARYLFVADALAAASSMTVTFDCTGDPATGCIITVFRVSGMTRTGLSAIKQWKGVAGTAGSTPSATFDASADTKNSTIGFLTNATNPAGLTPPTDWAEASDVGYATPNTGQEAIYRNSGFAGATITWGSTSATAFRGIIAELDTSAGP